MSRKMAAILVVVLGLATLLLASLTSNRPKVVRKADPSCSPCAVPKDAMIRFELATREREVRSLLQDPDRGCGACLRHVLDAQNHVDFGFLVAYSLLTAAIFLFLDRSPLLLASSGSRRLVRLGLATALAMLLGDATEDLILLRLTGPAPHFHPALEILIVAARLKWGALALSAFLVAGLQWNEHRRCRGNLLLLLALPYLLAGLAGGVALSTGRLSWYPPFAGFLGLAWVTSILTAAAALLSDRALQRLREIWGALKTLGRVLWPCRFAVGVVVVVSVALGFVPQGEDILQRTAELFQQNQFWGFFIGLTVYATASWYAARLALYFHRFNGEAAISPRLLEWTPRLIGSASFVGIILAFLHVRLFYESSLDDRTKTAIYWLIAMTLVLAVLFLWALSLRRRLLETALARGVHDRLETVMPADPGAEGAAGESPVRTFYPGYRTLAAAPAGTRAALYVFLLTAVASLLAFSTAALRVGPFVGSSAVVFLAAATWLPFGTVLAHVGHRHRLPLLSLLLLATVPFSAGNDNHAIRSGYPQGESETLSSALGTWVHLLDAKEPQASSHPLVVVAAEGGGSLAAYWTAAVLSEVQDKSRRQGISFADHVFAISSVSGGSLGGAVFASLAAEQAPRAPFAFRDLSTTMLGQDFLSPTLAMLLFPELLQKLLPVPIPDFDRSLALEHVWERRWHDALEAKGIESDRFAQPFTALFRDHRSWVPRLALNGTWVESGNRALTTSFVVDPEVFVDTADLRDLIRADLPLSTAVHNSARFPYVSPPGTVAGPNGEPIGHLIDGGLFENSGGSTAIEIVSEILRLKASEPQSFARVGPILVVLVNSTPAEEPNPPEAPPAGAAPRAQQKAASAPAGSPVPPPEPPSPPGEPPIRLAHWHRSKPSNGFLLGPAAPPEALMHSREARATWALLHLYKFPSGVETFQFGTCPTDHQHKRLPLPVSWQLSALAQEVMENQLKDGCGSFPNPVRVQQLVAKLRR